MLYDDTLHLNVLLEKITFLYIFSSFAFM